MKKVNGWFINLVWKFAPSLVFVHSHMEWFLENRRSCIIQTRGGLIWKHGKKRPFSSFSQVQNNAERYCVSSVTPWFHQEKQSFPCGRIPGKQMFLFLIQKAINNNNNNLSRTKYMENAFQPSLSSFGEFIGCSGEESLT